MTTILTIDPTNNAHTYKTEEGLSFTYDPKNKTWTNGDTTKTTDWIIGDIENRMYEDAFRFDDCFGVHSTLSPEEIRGARAAFLADQEALSSTIKLIETLTS